MSDREIIDDDGRLADAGDVGESSTPPSDAPNPPGDERDGRGRFVRGNTAGAGAWFERGNTVALLHGLRARNAPLPPELAAVEAEHDAFLRACVVDEGDDDVPTRRRALLAYRARLHRRIGMLDRALEMRGLIDRRGRLRVQWLAQWTNLINTARNLDAQLGLERRPKRVTALAEYIEGRYGAAAGQDASAAAGDGKAEDQDDRGATGQQDVEAAPSRGGDHDERGE